MKLRWRKADLLAKPPGEFPGREIFFRLNFWPTGGNYTYYCVGEVYNIGGDLDKWAWHSIPQAILSLHTVKDTFQDPCKFLADAKADLKTFVGRQLRDNYEPTTYD